MTLNQLRYFQAVCQYHSISKASAMLHVTQPAVSIALSNLEEEFGVTLFSRDNRLLEITDAGQVFLMLVNEVLANVDAIYEKMKDLQSNNCLLRLSIVPFSFSRNIQRIIDDFQSAASENKMNVYEYGSKTALQKLKTNQIDMALTVALSEKPNYIEGLWLYDENSVLAVGKDNPLASRSEISYSELSDSSLIMAKEDSYLTIMIEQRFKEVGVKPSSIYYFAQPNLIASILSSNKNSAAILSESLCESIQDIVRIPIIDPVNIKHLLLWKKGVQLTPGMKLFIKQMKKMYPQAAPY